MSFKVVRNAEGVAVASGPDDESYEPMVAAGCALTVEETAPAPSPPTKEQKIETLLSSKGVTRLLVQLTIEVSEDKAKALAPSYGLTEAQAIAYAYSKNKTYRECKDLEAAIRAIEVAP